jgi:TIR domain
MPSDIFISYAREDREFARSLAQTLVTNGWSVWWDRVIPPGKSWDDVIEGELTTARAVIVIWSPHSIQSRWVRAEAGEAMERNILIPIRVADVTPPLAFRHLQAADLHGWSGDPRDEGLVQLVEALASLAPAVEADKHTRRTNEEPVALEPYQSSVPEGELRSIFEFFQDWQHSPDPETRMLSELELREMLGNRLEERGENRRQANDGDVNALKAIARRLGLLR